MPTPSASPTAIILTEMAFILISGLKMTVSQCEIIISRFAITISHLEINFTMPSGINPLAATIKLRNSTTIPHISTTNPHNSTIKPHNSTTIPRATSRPSVITPVPLPCPTDIGMAVSWLSPPSAPPTTPTNLANPCGGGRKNGGGCNKIGHKYNKSGTDCVN